MSVNQFCLTAMFFFQEASHPLSPANTRWEFEDFPTLVQVATVTHRRLFHPLSTTATLQVPSRLQVYDRTATSPGSDQVQVLHRKTPAVLHNLQRFHVSDDR